MEYDCGFNTKLLHGKTSKSFPNREILPPISQVTAFRYDSMEELERVFLHKSMGYAYSRIGNPTITAFEQRIQELEGGNCLYGGTIGLFHDLEKWGIHIVYVKDLTEETVKPLINAHTKAIFGELISNPSLKVMNVPSISRLAHEAGIPLIVDSTTATPFIARPLELGADIVIHSTSKYLNGGGNSIGGVIVDGGTFRWNFEKHTALREFKKFGKLALSVRLRTDTWENLGGCMAPMNAFLSYIGTDTLGLRMQRICENADRLAHALDQMKGIQVSYLTLPSHPCYEEAKDILDGYGGGILSFRAGSKERAFRIINSLKYACIASNIGDVRTLVIHPASTLYIQASKEEMQAAGVYEDTVRVSVGIESADDLIADFTEAINNSREGKEDENYSFR